MACNSGGPLESVQDGETGFLLPPDEQKWGNKIVELFQKNPDKMKTAAKARVKAMFTIEVFSSNLAKMIRKMD